MSSSSTHWFRGHRQVLRPIVKPQKTSPQVRSPSIDSLNVDLKQAVRLPEGENLNEWLASNVTEFYNQLSMLYETITEFCTNEHCPVMCAGQGYKYRWRENDRDSEPLDVSAPEYARLLFDWINKLLDDENIFPSDDQTPFPDDFIEIVKTIMKRLFRIYAHCYYHHLDNFKALATISILNTSFKHFIFFNKEFDLIPDDQLEPLRDFIGEMFENKNESTY